MANQPKRSLRFLLPAALVFCGAGLLISGFDRSQIQNWIHGLGPAAPAVFVLVGIVLMSVLLPKTFVSLTAGALFGTSLGCFLMLVTAVIAAAINYAIGRWWLSESIRERLAAPPEGAGWAHAVHDLAAEAGVGFHVLIRMIPVPSMLVSYSMGAARACVGPFMSAAALGVIPQWLWVHGGSIAHVTDGTAKNPWQWVGPVVAIAAAIVVAVVVPRAAMRRVRERQAASAA